MSGVVDASGRYKADVVVEDAEVVGRMCIRFTLEERMSKSEAGGSEI